MGMRASGIKHRKDLHVDAFLAHRNAYPSPLVVSVTRRLGDASVALWESCLLRAVALRSCLLRVAWSGVCRASPYRACIRPAFGVSCVACRAGGGLSPSRIWGYTFSCVACRAEGGAVLLKVPMVLGEMPGVGLHP